MKIMTYDSYVNRTEVTESVTVELNMKKFVLLISEWQLPDQRGAVSKNEVIFSLL
jgi:hypothetical protein